MRQARPDRHAPEWQIWAALVTVYVVWGSTYLAIRVMVGTMPPLLSAGARFIIAGLLLFGYLGIRGGIGALRFSRGEWLGAGFVGLALLLGGNGLVVLGEREVPSGLAALLVAIVPLAVIVLRVIFGERVTGGTLVGVMAGFAGVAVLIVPRGMDGSVALGGMLMLVVAASSWSIGSYFSKRVELPHRPLASTGAQMVVGGIGLTVAGVLSGEIGLAQPQRFSTDSVLAFLYLIVMGSVVGYSAFTWLLQHAPVSQVSTYAFVNPVVAIFLGWALLNEDVNLTMILGAAMIVVSVGLTIRTESRAARQIAAARSHPASGPESRVTAPAEEFAEEPAVSPPA
jgi:drug/metabolite transporter (DMT)-like permease